MIFDIQKASTLKRASAFLLDLILFAVLAVGVAWLIGLACDYDGTLDTYTSNFEIYKTEVESIYGADAQITEQQFNALSDTARNAWNVAQSNYVKAMGYTIMMVSLGLFVAILVLEFIIPICLKNGQTIGKKVFSIGVIHQNGVKVNAFAMFVRAILGKYTVELMVPVLLLYMMLMFGTGIVSLIVIGLIAILELVLFFSSKGMHTFIHDVLAKTVCVDLPSQMVFETVEEMNAFRRNAYAEKSGEINSDGIYTGTSAISASLIEKPGTSEDTNTVVDGSSADNE